jgi:uncharacterized protein (DUF2237 family)
VQAFRLLNVLLWVWGAQAASLHCWAACPAAVVLIGDVALPEIGGLESAAPWLLCAMPTNVLGTELRCCCRDPMTGFYRDGYCRTGPDDVGLHTVCVEVTEEFLDFSVLDGNDLVTPMPEWGFPGLKPGDRWCVCVTRWKAALEKGRAAPIDLEATHSSVLEFVDLEDLKAHAVKV